MISLMVKMHEIVSVVLSMSHVVNKLIIMYKLITTACNPIFKFFWPFMILRIFFAMNDIFWQLMCYTEQWNHFKVVFCKYKLILLIDVWPISHENFLTDLTISNLGLLNFLRKNFFEQNLYSASYITNSIEIIWLCRLHRPYCKK